MLRKIYNQILQFFFPIRCVGCHLESFWMCPRCLRETEHSLGHPEKWIFPVFRYHDQKIKKLMWYLKFKKRHSAIDPLMDTMYDELVTELMEQHLFEGTRKPILAPIPITEARRRERGYNQAYVIAKKLHNRSQNFLELENILKKTKETPPQNTIKNRSERFENTAGCFAVRSRCNVSGKTVILVDDIVTTGATLLEAKKELKKHGASRVLAFTLAH